MTLQNGSTIGTIVGGTLSQSAIVASSPASVAGNITVDISGIPGVALPTGINNLITAPSGLDKGSPNYNIGFFNATNYTIGGLIVSDTAVAVKVSPATPLLDVYWLGGWGVNTANNAVWALSDGFAHSNWATDSSGGTLTSLVPGPTTTVHFSAGNAQNQGAMVLGANMSVKGIAVTDSTPIVLNADGNSLTLGTGGITVSTGGSLSLAAPVVLAAAQTWTNNSTNPTTVGGGISGSGGLTVVGNLVLTGTNSSTYTGPTLIKSGTLQFQKTDSQDQAGLWEGVVADGTNAWDTTDPIPHTSAQLSARWGTSNSTGSSPATYPNWPNSTTIGYSGYFYVPKAGTYTFGKSFDDNGYLAIDGSVIINDQNWSAAPTATDTLSAGWHPIDIRFGQGGGGVGPQGQFGNFGLAYEAPGSSTWTQFADPGDESVLSTDGIITENLLAVTTPLTINSGATLDMNGVPQQVASLSGSGLLTNSNAVASCVLTVGDSSSTVFYGQITDSFSSTSGNGGSLGLTKIGAGKLVLAGDNNYGGATTVSGGTLTLSGNNSIGANGGNVTVNGAGAVLQIAGTGTTTLSSSNSTTNVDGGGTLLINGQYISGGATAIGGSTIGNVVLAGSWTAAGGNGAPQYVPIMVGVNGVGTLTINTGAALIMPTSGFAGMALGLGASSAGHVIQNGGLVSCAQGSDWDIDWGSGIVLGGFSPSSTSTYALNGGTLSVGTIMNITNGPGGWGYYGPPSTFPGGANYAEFDFNGGTLQAIQGDGSWDPAGLGGSNYLITNLSHAYVQKGGAFIDTNGFSTGINQSLEHSGTGSDGGLLVTGGGTLTLWQAGTFNGPTSVQQGTTLAIADSGGSAIGMSTLDTSGAGTLDLTSTAISSLTLGGLSGPGATTLLVNSPIPLTVGATASPRPTPVRCPPAPLPA